MCTYEYMLSLIHALVTRAKLGGRRRLCSPYVTVRLWLSPLVLPGVASKIHGRPPVSFCTPGIWRYYILARSRRTLTTLRGKRGREVLNDPLPFAQRRPCICFHTCSLLHGRSFAPQWLAQDDASSACGIQQARDTVAPIALAHRGED